MTIDGKVLWRGEPGYEEARRSAVWNHRKPDRYPEVIVQVTSDEDVAAAVRLARERGLSVKARGGGHSWTASHIRDGMLIDFEHYKRITIDPEARRATVTPSVYGIELNDALRPHDLFFPGGHCPDVGLGGYLLQGGFGWNGRALGPACASVRAIDVVTAGGELIYSDDTTNPDFVWAARGSGPGFFGVVTRFYLDLHPRPEALLSSTYVFGMSTFDEVVPWFLETSSDLPPEIAPYLFAQAGPGGPTMAVTSVSFAGETEGRAALAALDSCPAVRQASECSVATETTFADLYALMNDANPHGLRYCVDGMWADAADRELVGELRDLFATTPTPTSFVVLLPWRESDVPNGVFSMQASLYVSPVVSWQDPADDQRCTAWATGQMRRLERFSKGIQLADENLINRPAPFLAAEQLERLERLRATHDPDGVFHSYLIGT